MKEDATIAAMLGQDPEYQYYLAALSADIVSDDEQAEYDRRLDIRCDELGVHIVGGEYRYK